jgi:UDP-GlcNAc3NAcA epimerase
LETSWRNVQVKIATIVGARPQFVKAAVVSRALRTIPGVTELMVHTGQHYDSQMSDVFFRELDIAKPQYNLAIGSGSHGKQTGRMLEEIERVLIAEQPDGVSVYGDTNSTLAGALAAVKLHLPVAHVEAGLRSFNRRMPEEINRVLTDHASDLLFAPTPTAVEHLRREGIQEACVHLVGDVMYDAALQFGQRAETVSTILRELQLEPHSYLLATIHRPENTDSKVRFDVIRTALARMGMQMRVVVPLHPRSQAVLAREGLLDAFSRQVTVIEPVGYLDMLMLEKHARLIATDSGGVQKEAFFYRVPCVTLRDETEWVESVELGWNRLAQPTSAASVLSTLEAALEAPPGQDLDPYGDGHSSERIAAIMHKCWAQTAEVETSLAV